MSAPIPAAPRTNLLSPLTKAEKPKYTPPEHLTRSIGSEFPALRALGSKTTVNRKGGKR